MTDDSPEANSSEAESVRIRRAEQVLLEYLEQRQEGGAVAEEAILAAHPELMPELGEMLRHARMISSAYRNAELEASSGSSDDDSAFSRAQLAAATSESAPGQRLTHYRIVELLGAGGMGEVFRAEDLRLGRGVALKLLPRQYAQDGQWLKRFQREARLVASLNHPHICVVYDVGEHEGRPFFVMELVEGRTLRGLIHERLPAREIRQIGAQVAAALAAAHAAGVVHRDIKPENIMLRSDGYLKVLDFGLARQSSAHDASGDSSVGSFETQSGVLLGTIRYMSPEQAQGEEVGTPSDVFSLGTVLYELATGRHPFVAESRVAALQAIVAESPMSVSRLNAEIPSAVATLIARMLEKDPRQRPTAAEVHAGLTTAADIGTESPHAGLPQRTAPRVTIGREQELASLRALLAQVADGRGQVVCVSGEPGIGKTTLMRAFLAELDGVRDRCAIAEGRSSERLAGIEAYLPFLEAFDALLQGPHRDTAGRLMHALAPNWYVQVASLSSNDPLSAGVPAELKSVSQERLKRELTAFLQELSRLRPVVLFFDDLHWADVSTIDLLAFLATRLDSIRLMVVVTFRSAELQLANHPFLKLKPDLQARGVCHEMALGFLNREDIDKYLALEFPEHRFPPELATLVHVKTEGSPLFMVDLVRYLRDRRVIAQQHGCWMLAQPLPDIERELPESVRAMIDRKVSQLAEEDSRLLAAGSIQGYEFDSAVVSRILDMDASEVEERLEALERIHGFVRLVDEREYPDHTLTVRYRFVHVLYQNALYARLRPTRKAQLSRAVAETLVDHYGEKCGTVASELAHLFEAARNFAQAADYFLMAAEDAARIFAYQEAITLANRGLAVLKKLPNTTERNRQEIDFLFALGPALIAVKGYAVPEVVQVYTRARELCAQVGDHSQLFTALYNMFIILDLRADMPGAHDMAAQCLDLAQTTKDSAHLVLAHTSVGEINMLSGELLIGRRHHELAIGMYDVKQHGSLSWQHAGYDPGVASYAIGAHGVWCLGYPDLALARSRLAVALASELRDHHSLALALCHASMLHFFRRENQLTWQRAEETLALSLEHGLTFWMAIANILRGWIIAQQGRSNEGIPMIREGIEAYRTTGSAIELGLFAIVLANAYQQAGQITDAKKSLAEGLAETERKGVNFCQAELTRRLGELLLAEAILETGQQADGSEIRKWNEVPAPAVAQAESCFRKAMDVARRQQAKSLELRAAMSLGRLWQHGNKKDDARVLVADVYGWFTEGLTTPDLEDAAELLQELTTA
jgi:adenylate cyclase